MAARAEMSTNAQGTQPKSGAPPKGMSVALIGPNDAHRQVVARALASAQGRKVHEFIDYPATLEDLARMMETRFDVVLVDVDTDESYALQIITRLAEIGPAVMAYSARTDDDLVASCMRAGASDFLPLPDEKAPSAPSTTPAAAPVSAPPPAAPVQAAPVPPAPPKPVASVPQPSPRAVAPPQQRAATVAEPKPAPPPRSNVTPIIPQKPLEPVEDLWAPPVPEARPVHEPVKMAEAPASVDELDILKDEAKSDFAAWDAAHLRRQSMPPVARPETPPRPALVPEKRKSPEPVVRSAPPAEESVAAPATSPAPVPPTPVIERPPISTDIFRSSTFLSEPSEAAEKQGARWVKWILIAAGPAVVGLVLLIVFMRPSTQNPAAAAAKNTTAATAAPSSVETPAPDPTASERLIVNATGKPQAGVATNYSSTSPSQPPQVAESNTGSEEPKNVSPDAMAAQLVAPTRIAGQINTKPASDEPPPIAPASLEESNSMSGAVFGSGSKLKVTPHVVPISEGLASGMLIHKTTPIYPKYAQDAHITGTVVLKATITKQGTIEGIQVLSGPKILAPSAVEAVRTWKYRPYLLDGQPVSVETDIKVVFGGR